MNEHIRTWQDGPFRLELYDTNQTRYGKSQLAYQFYHNGKLVFEGDDFCASPLHAIDGDETVAGLLTFLSLRPGDTDPEYFEGYTPEQMDFAQQEGENLSLLAMEMEENARRS